MNNKVFFLLKNGNFKIYIKILLSLFCCLIVSGCWDRVELDQLAMVIGVGIDYDREKKEIKLVTEIIKPEQTTAPTSSGGSGAGTSEQNASFLLEAKGRTVFETARQLALQNSRQMFWDHSELIVLGKTIVKEGVSKYLDFFIRKKEPRLLQGVLVAEADTKSVFEVKTDLEKTVAMTVDGLLKNTKITSKVQSVDLIKFITNLMSETTSATAPIIKTIGEGEDKKLELSGTAIFRKDRMVGKLNSLQTRGLLWIRDEVEGGIIVVELGEEYLISLEIINATSEIRPILKNGQLEVHLKVHLNTNLGGQVSSVDMSTPEGILTLEKLAQQEIYKEVMSAVKEAQKLRTDIFGFGDMFHRKYPKKWAKFKGEWDQIFPRIKVKVHSHVSVGLLGKTTKSLGSFK